LISAAMLAISRDNVDFVEFLCKLNTSEFFTIKVRVKEVLLAYSDFCDESRGFPLLLSHL
jgi:hypothetical protein